MRRETLCWTCQRASTTRDKQCGWVRCFKPIENWEAIPKRIIENRVKYMDTYQVISCPLYLKDER